MLFKFMRDGKQVNSAVAEDVVKAAKICGLSDEDYNSVETENTEVPTPPVKTRKLRADKGLPRKGKRVVTSVTKKVTEKSRKKPEYFVLDEDGILSTVLTHNEATKFIEDSDKDTIRVIMGHEISFTRSVKFHLKS